MNSIRKPSAFFVEFDQGCTHKDEVLHIHKIISPFNSCTRLFLDIHVVFLLDEELDSNFFKASFQCRK